MYAIKVSDEKGDNHCYWECSNIEEQDSRNLINEETSQLSH